MFLRKNSNTNAIDVLEKHAQMLSKDSVKRIEVINTISSQLSEGWESKIINEASDIVYVNRAREAMLIVISDIKQSLPVAISSSGIRTLKYQISSIFLKECCEHTISDPKRNERLHLLTGTITQDGTRILSRIEKVRLEKQSPVYVCAENKDSHNKIRSLQEDHGHLLLAMFHSHTSKGAASTSPSSIDIKNLERKLKIGIDCLGGIFSMDRYVRFFSLKEFEIDIYGKGIEEIEIHPTYKIFKIHNTVTL